MILKPPASTTFESQIAKSEIAFQTQQFVLGSLNDFCYIPEIPN